MKRFYGILALACLSLAAVSCSGELEDGDDAVGKLQLEEDFETVPEFERHICVMEFTGQWCSNCPRGYQLLDLAVNYDDRYKDVTHIMALHDNSGGEDEFAAPLQDVQLEIFREFTSADKGGLNGYPSIVVDLREGVMLPEGNIGAALKRSLDEPATCGLALSSTYDAAKGTAEIKVRLGSAASDSYRVALFVIEDGIQAYQNNGGVPDQAYPHRHVARKMLSGSYIGDSMGTLDSGKQVSRMYSLSVEPEWNVGKTEIYALAINGRNQINNVAVCRLDGGNTDYNYRKQ